jgi:hypothetical protein
MEYTTNKLIDTKLKYITPFFYRKYINPLESTNLFVDNVKDRELFHMIYDVPMFENDLKQYSTNDNASYN